MLSRTLRPALGRLRFATTEDAPVILDLVNESMSRNFRIDSRSDIVYLIENSVLSICQLDANETIVGFLSAKDYPLLPSVHPRAWEEYIWTKYKATELTSRNTLFIHLLCWSPEYARELIDSLLKSMFMHDPYLHYIAMIKNFTAYPLLVPGQSRSEGSFRRVLVMERGMPGELLPALCIADRGTVSPRLRIRRAVEEDNDDLVPIIERHSPRLREMYGEFYISELISRHPESERILLVCEHKELAVGVMCLNTVINFEALEESFELSPFGGLRHFDCRNAKTDHKGDEKGNLSASANKLETIPRGLDEQLASKPTSEKRVSMFKEKDFLEPRIQIYAEPSDMHLTAASVHMLSLLEEDDELDFDIVNIEADLLRVPDVLTYEGQEYGLADGIMRILDDTARREIITVKKEKYKLTTNVGKSQPDTVRYSGRPNAFLLELFAMHEDYDERYGFDMLETAFDLFPEKDYCVMCLPSNHPPFPLLEHFTLVTPYGTRMRFINDTLYVAHVNSVRGEVSVRPGEASDIVALGDVLEHAPRASSLMDLIETSLTSPTLSSYVLLSQKQPVGVVILGPLEDGTAIRTQYALEPEPRRARTDGTVLAGVLSPALEPHSRWYMRELLRHSHYTTLFWICRLFAEGDSSPSRNLMSLAGHMAPVRPRHSVPNISGVKELDKIFQDLATPFAVWAIERPLTSLPLVLVNNGIVVVGASRTGLSFLETLILGPSSQYIAFSNLTLVSSHGLPTAADCLQAAVTCVPRPGRYCDRHLKSVPFHYYVDSVTATMVGIDRKSKCIHLKGGGVKFYDALVLTCGLQFQHPEYMQRTIEIAKEIERGKPCERMLMDDPEYQPDKVPPLPDIPENLMLVNSIFDANNCFRKLLRMMKDASEKKYVLNKDCPVVVYGECVEAYNCVAGLLQLGLSPQTITIVEPFPPEDGTLRINCFNDETVDSRVQATLTDMRVRILRGYTLNGWHLSGTRIDAINLISTLHASLQPCFALFYYGRRAIDISAFKAINKSGLVYDGGLIVGPSFETNDPYVYGAGPCTQYSRRLYADHLKHVHYRPEDVGEALAKIFLHNLNPFAMANPGAGTGNSDLIPSYSSSLLASKSTASCDDLSPVGHDFSKRWEPVIQFHSPIVHYSVLPGPLYYLKVRKPGPEIPMEVQLSLPLQGHALVTDKDGDYFCLKLNALHCVEAVTCLSKKCFSIEILTQLYGKHEAIFHKLLYRFQRQEIDDLYEYFTQPCMLALYLEPFSDLLDIIKQQDVASVFDVEQCHFTGDGATCATVSSCSCEIQREELQYLDTFRSIVEKYVSKMKSPKSECGHSVYLRDSAAAFWRAVDGDQLAISLLSRYLSRHSGTHTHYAPPIIDYL